MNGLLKLMESSPMKVRVEVRGCNIFIHEDCGGPPHHTDLVGAAAWIGERFAEYPQLTIQLAADEPKIMVKRYIGKKISESQINYLVKIISERTERQAHIKILCQWLKKNSIRWEKV